MRQGCLIKPDSVQLYVGSRCGELYKKGKMENNREENIHTMYADNMIAEDEEEKKAVLSRLERYGKNWM